MSLLTDEQVKALVEKPANAGVLARARGIRDQHRRHITGVGVDPYLDKIETYENKDQWLLRKKLAQPSTVPIFAKELQTFNKVFSAQGTAKHYKFFDQESDLVNDFTEYLNTDVGGGFTIRHWMSNTWLNKVNIDATGLLMVDLPKELTTPRPQPFLKYIGIDSIHDIGFNGMKIEYLIINVSINPNDALDTHHLKQIKEATKVKAIQFFRVIDDAFDRIVMLKDGKATIINNDNFPIIENFWKYVPAIFMSSVQDGETTAKTTYVWQAMPPADEYLLDSSVHTISKKLHGFPQKWEQERGCRKCKGEKRFRSAEMNDEGEWDWTDCGECKGTGVRLKADTSEVFIVARPDTAEDTYNVPPFGYGEAPIGILKEQREGLFDNRKLIRIAIWANPDRAFFQQSGSAETATGRSIDIGEIHDKLNKVSANAEMVEKFLTDTIGMARYGRDIFMGSVIKYGRTYLIFSAEELEQQYIKAKAGGVQLSQLQAIRHEIILVRWQNDPFMLDRQMKLSALEPMPDLSIEEVNGLAIVSTSDKTFKTYFNDYIERFEFEMKQPITMFTIEFVQKKILEFNQQKLASQDSEPITPPVDEPTNP